MLVNVGRPIRHSISLYGTLYSSGGDGVVYTPIIDEANSIGFVMGIKRVYNGNIKICDPGRIFLL